MKRAIVASHLILFLGLNLPANNWKTDRDSLLVQVENLQVHSISSSQSITNTNIEQDSGHAVLLKTNMLYDAAAIPNIGLEVSVGKGWSVGANWMYAWWSNDARHRFWRAYGGDVELRRWFSPRRESRSLMCGHHIGVYGHTFRYRDGGDYMCRAAVFEGNRGGLPYADRSICLQIARWKDAIAWNGRKCGWKQYKEM